MKKYTLLIFSFLLVSFADAQDPSLTVSSLMGTHVDTILKNHLEGKGVFITNGKFNNVEGNVTYPQIGTFNSNGSYFPFETGIVLTTGNVSVAEGPNNSGAASSQVSNPYVESQLQPLANSPVTSSASLEFDFVASTDTFAVSYIFGSEEYPEYVGSSFLDVFAFFLTGIDPVTIMITTKNVAIIPGSITASNPNGIPVSINNVNSTTNPEYYTANPSIGVQYDGYTTALTASATILACQSYHMKLAVSNVSDQALDSGVFVEEGSFYSPQMQIEQQWSDTIGGDTLIQNFREMDLLFKLPRPALTGYTDVIINTSGDAVLGQDYALTMSFGMEITPSTYGFVFQPDDATLPAHVEILPTAQFPEEMPVKTAILEVIAQGCGGTSFTDAFPPRRDTIVLHLRAIDSVSIPDRSLPGGLMVYPNPATDVINVQCTMNNEQINVTGVEVYDVYGKLVASVETMHAPSLQMDISNLPPGIFTLKVTLSDGSVTMQKMVKR